MLEKLIENLYSAYTLDSYKNSGFEWIDYGDAEHSVLVYIRKGNKPKDNLIVACNMTPMPLENYRIGLPKSGSLKQVFNSDDKKYYDELVDLSPQDAWLEARDRAVEVAKSFLDAGYHKQVVNRLLEPFSHISVIATASGWDNFFHLRSHPDAQPEIQILSNAMVVAIQESTPRELGPNDWHRPYITPEDYFNLLVEPNDETKRLIDDLGCDNDELMNMISAARCARVSFLTHDGNKPSVEKDLALADRLVGSSPLHASPTEHQAKLDVMDTGPLGHGWANSHLAGNFGPGFIQFRKTLADECINHYDPIH